MKSQTRKSKTAASDVKAEVAEFFIHLEGIVAEGMKMSSEKEEVGIGARLFILGSGTGREKCPVFHIPLNKAQDVSDRAEIVVTAVHKVALQADITVEAFVIIAEAWMSEIDKTRPSLDPRRKEVVVMTALDGRGNYRFSAKEICRSPKGITLKEYEVSAIDSVAAKSGINGWMKLDSKGAVQGSEQEVIEDCLLTTAWREYNFAKLLAGVNIPV